MESKKPTFTTNKSHKALTKVQNTNENVRDRDRVGNDFYVDMLEVYRNLNKDKGKKTMNEKQKSSSPDAGNNKKIRRLEVTDMHIKNKQVTSPFKLKHIALDMNTKNEDEANSKKDKVVDNKLDIKSKSNNAVHLNLINPNNLDSAPKEVEASRPISTQNVNNPIVLYKMENSKSEQALNDNNLKEKEDKIKKRKKKTCGCFFLF